MRSLRSILSPKLPGSALRVSGYATFFWKEDENADVLAPGAFSEDLALGPFYRPMFYNHVYEELAIGAWDHIQASEYGIYVSGVINPRFSLGRGITEAVIKGYMRSLSIGYHKYRLFETLGGAELCDSAVLQEISICDGGAMEGAVISDYRWIRNPFTGRAGEK